MKLNNEMHRYYYVTHENISMIFGDNGNEMWYTCHPNEIKCFRIFLIFPALASLFLIALFTTLIINK